ncbi:MAG: type II toxin-antitoxin system VapC family toxin [Candidatus Diapherotrites archaeon]|nr:type II toxin-antitoxin system VapC family toxin [Candidatus Diapherotrites archaeon]
MRLYIDTNVPISLVTGEFGKNYEFMEERVRRFLSVCEEEKHTLIISDWMTKELEGVKPHCSNWIQDFAAENIIEYVELTREDSLKAKTISNAKGIHYSDARHVQLALKSKADAIITWDTKDFQKVSDLITVMTPEQFI